MRCASRSRSPPPSPRPSGLIAGWEAQVRVQPSQPQVSIGAGAARWLGALERRMPRAATQPVGRPAVETTSAAAPRR